MRPEFHLRSAHTYRSYHATCLLRVLDASHTYTVSHTIVSYIFLLLNGKRPDSRVSWSPEARGQVGAGALAAGVAGAAMAMGGGTPRDGDGGGGTPRDGDGTPEAAPAKQLAQAPQPTQF